ncbi:MAG: hypothetical protein ACFFHD_16520 [Promethearchaeota archaeon]
MSTNQEIPKEQDISDKKLFIKHIYVGIACLIMAGMISGLASSPYNTPAVSAIDIALATFLFFLAVINFVIYGTKPEKLKQRYLEYRAKKAAK